MRTYLFTLEAIEKLGRQLISHHLLTSPWKNHSEQTDKPNYDSVSVAMCEKELESSRIPANIMVDCSHANSNKKHDLQPLVLDNIANQIAEGNKSIIGVMIESNIGAGNQKMTANKADLQYGVSITDACIDWATTEKCLRSMRDKLKTVLPNR